MPDPGSAPNVPAWGDLRLRVLSALVLLPVGLGCLWAGGWVWAALIAFGAVALAFEWGRLCGESAKRTAASAVVQVVVVGIATAGWSAQALAALVGGMIAVWTIEGRIVPALGVPYVGLCAVALIWLRGAAEIGRDTVLFMLLVVWATDVAAYAAGRLLGGPRLAPSISPGKTWSGAAGGFAGALLIGWLAAPGLPGLALAALLSLVAQAGDLMESGIKRRFGVKDSGNLIPGHGGLLDRLDGILTAAPVAALLVLITGRGVGFWQ